MRGGVGTTGPLRGAAALLVGSLLLDRPALAAAPAASQQAPAAAVVPSAPPPPVPAPAAAPASDAVPAAAAPASPATAVAPASPPSAAPPWTPPSFGNDPIGTIATATDLVLKMYGDTGFAIRNNANQTWPTGTANANVYAPGVWNSFFAPRLDIFGSADVGKLSFLTEVMFEANNDNFTIDIERMQLNYLFANWMRVTAGRSHMAWGYYNDSYHHGNLFELTTSRPYSVNFEDSFGIILAHNVGVAIDGTFDLGSAGAFRYDAEIGTGRASDVTAVDMQFAEANPRNYNLRLRWMPIDGLILGVNGMLGSVPSLSAANAGTVSVRPETQERVAGAHAVYTEHHFIIDVEAFAMRHNPSGLPSTNIYGGFAEIGYAIGAFTPYVRPEYMVFPAAGDVVYQYGATDAQGLLGGFPSIYYGVRDFSDLRVGVKWLAMPQLALKLEGERLARDSQDQEIATIKAAFGF
jgi:hypothetical protein